MIINKTHTGLNVWWVEPKFGIQADSFANSAQFLNFLPHQINKTKMVRIN